MHLLIGLAIALFGVIWKVAVVMVHNHHGRLFLLSRTKTNVVWLKNKAPPGSRRQMLLIQLINWISSLEESLKLIHRPGLLRPIQGATAMQAPRKNLVQAEPSQFQVTLARIGNGVISFAISRYMLLLLVLIIVSLVIDERILKRGGGIAISLIFAIWLWKHRPLWLWNKKPPVQDQEEGDEPAQSEFDPGLFGSTSRGNTPLL